MPATIIPLDRFKAHTRTDDFTADDAILESYLAAAEAKAIRDSGRSVCELFEMGGGGLPLDLEQAIMMLAAHWYAHRESVSPVELRSVPLAYDNIIASVARLTPRKQP